MTPTIPSTLLDEASQWGDLHRWERKQLGMSLRRLGLTYSEIQNVIPVPKGTLSNWSRDVPLTPEQVAAITERTGPPNFVGVPKDTQWRRRHALRTFVAWVRTYLDADAEFVLSIHLHSGNDEVAAKEYWRRATGLCNARFTKTYIKPPGTGHRKNHLPHGVCRVRTLCASNHWNRTMVWIDVVAVHLGPLDDSNC